MRNLLFILLALSVVATMGDAQAERRRVLAIDELVSSYPPPQQDCIREVYEFCQARYDMCYESGGYNCNDALTQCLEDGMHAKCGRIPEGQRYPSSAM